MATRTSMLCAVMVAAQMTCGRASSETADSGPPSAGAAAPTASRIAEVVDPLIRRALSEERIPGAAFVFVHGDRVVYAQGYGMADLEQRVPVDVEHTVWPIASVTKLFTGVAAMQLVDSGDLTLDADIN